MYMNSVQYNFICGHAFDYEISINIINKYNNNKYSTLSTTSLAKLNSRETCVKTSLTKTTNAGADRNTFIGSRDIRAISNLYTHKA